MASEPLDFLSCDHVGKESDHGLPTLSEATKAAE